MEIKLVKRFECSICNNNYKTEDEAEQCLSDCQFDQDIEEDAVWKCNCGEHFYHDKEDAETCLENKEVKK